jgi:ABC-2 type transport system permease protein
VLQREADAAVGLRPAVRVVTSRYAAAAPATEFDYYTPGVFVFALLLVLPFASMIVAREIRWKTLRRLRLTRMRAFDLFAGITGALLLLGILNTALVFVVAPAFGFHNNGSTALALAVAVAMIFSGIGLGLIVGCFTTTDSQAMNIAAGVMMLQVFLSGSFFPIPAPTVFTLAGHEIGAFDVFPATHGYLALQQVLSDGAGLDAVAFRLGATVLLSLLCFVLGVVIFRRLRMRDAR